jgi:galactokinase
MSSRAELAARFQSGLSGPPRTYRAPGRVNLIGEHTDYNGGYVLPAALQLSARVTAAPRPDRQLRMCSLDTGGVAEFDLNETSPRPLGDWTDYVRGVAVMLERSGLRVPGADLLIDSKVPIGAGLSSSAALEVSVGYALLDLGGHSIDRTALALSCQKAENEFAGMRCGIMDQFIACHGSAGHALLLDCRSLEFRLVPIDPSVRLVICNSMVHHELAATEYNLRRQECERSVSLLAARLPAVRALRDVRVAQLPQCADMLPLLTFRRCRHVVTEIDRVLRAEAALGVGDLAGFGRLMTESHRSLRDDYEVSCPELDTLVDLAGKVDGVFGARMTGGGFGGCTVSLVRADAVGRFSEAVAPGYQAATGLTPDIFVCSPGPAAGPAEKLPA